MPNKNIVTSGIGVSKRYAIGTACMIDEWKDKREKRAADTPEKEANRLKTAVELSKKQIQGIIAQANQKFSAKNAEIIKSQLDFLDDPAFIGEAFSQIKKNSVSAEKAMSDITKSLYDTFSSFDDEYTRERATDIKDVGERVVKNLTGGTNELDFDSLPENTVLFAHNLKPSDTAQIDKRKVSALVTEIGGKTSHTAILARALGIAAIVGCADILGKIKNGMPVIVDGISGKVIIDPDENTVEKYRALMMELDQSKAEQFKAAQKNVRTKSGKTILVAANIGNLDDLKTALKNGADGVGLFRTEFLYMGRQKMPSEEKQFEIYKKASQMLGGKPLTIRTLDIGGDKSLPYFKLPEEANPFLGLRAIRLCLKNPGLFKVQLRAILRASAFGNIQIMFPMISNLKELREAKKILNECKRELDQEGKSYHPSVKVGMMIEIPAAAITAEDFAKETDFFSIGTNDLTQYTLAVDRMNENVSALYEPMHPAVLRLIETTISAAHSASIPCCMCGEFASDERAVSLLLKYGLDEFSVSPGALIETKCNLIKEIEKN